MPTSIESGCHSFAMQTQSMRIRLLASSVIFHAQQLLIRIQCIQYTILSFLLNQKTICVLLWQFLVLFHQQFVFVQFDLNILSVLKCTHRHELRTSAMAHFIDIFTSKPLFSTMNFNEIRLWFRFDLTYSHKRYEIWHFWRQPHPKWKLNFPISSN